MNIRDVFQRILANQYLALYTVSISYRHLYVTDSIVGRQRTMDVNATVQSCIGGRRYNISILCLQLTKLIVIVYTVNPYRDIR